MNVKFSIQIFGCLNERIPIYAKTCLHTTTYQEFIIEESILLSYTPVEGRIVKL